MGGPGRPRLSRQLEQVFWSAIREGSSTAEAAAAAGVSEPSGLRWFRQRGGVLPPPPRRAGSRPRLNLEQREEIAILKAQDLSNAEIARRVGVHRSTIRRELAAGSSFRPHRRPTYRASVA